MEREVKLLGERAEKDKYLIAELIHEEALENAAPEDLEGHEELLDSVIEFRASLIDLIGKSIENYFDAKTAFEEITEWGRATGNYFLEQGMMLDQALAETQIYRKHIAKVLKTEAVRENIQLEMLFDIMEFFHSLLDHAAYSYSFSYIDAYQKNLSDARKEYLELSSPVVPVNDEIAILPIVGEIEMDRAHYLLEKTLLAAVRLQVSTLIIDLSGVVKVDAMVAEQIIKLTEALKLVGIRGVLTGVRPEIAQTITHLSVDVSQLALGGSLKQAFKKLAAETK